VQPAQVIESIRETGVIAVLRAPDPRSAILAIGALVAGGVRGIEVTYSTPGAPAVIKEAAARYGDDIVLGAGTVRTPGQAAAAADAGARFLVSPGTSEQLARAMLDTGTAVLLGTLTPSEVMRATELGAHAVKIFPASLGGPAYLRALRAPMPEVPFMPTGGVSAGNLADWLDAGALAVGAGSELCSPADMAAGRWDVVTGRAREFAAALSGARQRALP
jgi:2-dehydro-3-deoxyphosphogluconate aldolase / (4S)-4-hydroxy-2-oxoglutarate aldolase